jgi:hypothetical protein
MHAHTFSHLTPLLSSPFTYFIIFQADTLYDASALDGDGDLSFDGDGDIDVANLSPSLRAR